jgi:hypothetical protein
MPVRSRTTEPRSNAIASWDRPTSGRSPPRVRGGGRPRIFLNHELYDDLEMIEVVATDVLPKVDP